MSGVASLRQIRRRIRSVENTKKITRAMEMVAAAKLRRFQDFLESAQPYTEKMAGLLKRFLEELPAGYEHPFLGTISPRDRFDTKKGQVTFSTSRNLESMESKSSLSLFSRSPLLVIFTSDTGLCGTYNAELEAFARDWMKQNSEKKFCFVFVGKHGANHLQDLGGRALATFSDSRVSRVDEILEGLRKTLESAFLGSEVDEVLAFYTRMETLARYRPAMERILPMAGGGGPPRLPSGQAPAPAPTIQDLVEPDRKTVLDKLIPAFFEAGLRFLFYHALLTEQIARMTAMRQATQNAEEMIDELTLLRNKARQAAITKEIIEVVSGSRAQKLK